jgi:hypothetical protein
MTPRNRFPGEHRWQEMSFLSMSRMKPSPIAWHMEEVAEAWRRLRQEHANIGTEGSAASCHPAGQPAVDAQARWRAGHEEG